AVRAGLVQILAELGEMHRRGVIHGPLSPSGIVRDADGGFHVRPESGGAVPDGYAAPERRAGRPPTARTDIYAVGAIAFFMLTGRAPDTMPASPSQAVTGISRGWDEWVKRCTAPEPSRRFQGAAEAVEAIPGHRTGARFARAAVIFAVISVFVAGLAWLVVAMVGAISEMASRGPEMIAPVNSAQSRGADSPLQDAPASPTSAGTEQPTLPKENRAWFVPSVGMDMVWIRPGRFAMGSPESEAGRSENETRREVVISTGFWLGRSEVTHSEWKAVMGTDPSAFHPDADNAPVEMVSWLDATQFCQKLTQIERKAGRIPGGWEYALPTEAQWEYACRAGASAPIYTGPLRLSGDGTSETLAEIAWYAGNSQAAIRGADGEIPVSAGPHPVGALKPNHFSLCDMLGNVREWCSDYYGPYPDDANPDPSGPSTGSARVVRGGAWTDPAASCRSAARSSSGPYSRNASTGFRVALRRIVPLAMISQIDIEPDQIRDADETASPLFYNRPELEKNWRLRDIGLDMVWIAPGSFQMGSPETEDSRDPDESPRHAVTLSKGFWMGRYEVTQGQWMAVMGTDLDSQRGLDGAESVIEVRGGSWPMYYVSWEDASRFCERLNETEKVAGRLPEGYRYALPGEAQWEYACRAGSEGMFSSPTLDPVAWFDADSDADSSSGPAPHPVGRKKGNAFGLYDMHGNLFEWCADWYGSYAEAPAADPAGPATGEFRVFRGGSWLTAPGKCRSAYRGSAKPDLRGEGIGFRLALVPEN
ncbi:MAG TPA: SUMF1/EgtB/PvdO family nonheme iron enzyme, partial [Opitutales bacterium]|nr:SUMF1/EgtB/PvdO family nonheme iron enzyme [Opitutales bacterium]